MITITLQKIRDQRPCTNGWAAVLRAHQHLGIDTEFPLSSVIESNDLDDALWCLRCLPEYDSLWRKYAVWCGRQVEHLMTDERSVNALNVAWRHSNGEATDDELAAAWAAGDAAWAAAGDAAGDAAWAAVWATGDAAWDAAGDAVWAAGAAAWAARDAAGSAAGAAAWAAARGAAWATAGRKQREKLLQILTAGEWVEDSDSEQLRAGGEW